MRGCAADLDRRADDVRRFARVRQGHAEGHLRAAAPRTADAGSRIARAEAPGAAGDPRPLTLRRLTTGRSAAWLRAKLCPVLEVPGFESRRRPGSSSLRRRHGRCRTPAGAALRPGPDRRPPERRRPALRRDRRRAAGATWRAARPTTSSRSTFRPASDPYEQRGAACSRQWRERGRHRPATSEPALWPLEQEYTGPDGNAAHAARVPRARARGGIRAGPDPTPRAHPPGPEGGPAQADPRDEGQPLPDLLAVRRPAGAATGASATTTVTASPGRGDRRGRHRQPALAGRRPGHDREDHGALDRAPSS